MTFHIKLKDSPYAFEVEEGETILEGALRQGVDIPFSCQSGACSTCKGKVISGSFNYGGFPITGIDPDNDQNDALFCCAFPSSDMEISLATDSHEYPPAQDFTCKVLNKQNLGAQMMLIRLQPLQNMRFRAGQYLEVKTPDKNYPLSLANAPDNPYVEIHLQILPEQAYSETLLKHLTEQTQIQVYGPLGEAYLREDSQKPLILVAGGSGFAPIKSILERLFTQGSKREVHLYWGVRHPGLLYLNDTVEKWSKLLPSFKYIPVISEPCLEWQGRRGLVHHAVLEDFSDLSGYEAYLAGPFAMSYAARTDFSQRGMPTTSMYSDAFAFERPLNNNIIS